MKKNNLISIILLTMILSLFLPIDMVSAANELKLEQTAGSVTIEGNKSTKVSIKITNSTDSTITGVVAKINSNSMPHEPFTNKEIDLGNIDSKKSVVATWNMNTTGLDLSTSYKLPVTVTSKDGYNSTHDAVIFVFPDDNDTSGEKVSKSTITVQPTSGNLTSGSNSSLTITVSNQGNTILNDLVVSLSTLPEGVTLNNANLFIPIGSLYTNKSQSVNVPIKISKSVEGGSYGFTATVTGTDSEKKAVNFTQTSFIDIKTGSSGAGASLSINDFTLPKEAAAGATFNTKFILKNDSSVNVKNLKVTVKGGEGLINKTKNIFTDVSFAGGISKEYNVTFFTLDKTESKNIPIEIVVEYLEDGIKEPIIFSQFEGVFINDSGGANGTGIKTPQLIVNGYNYGGDSVKAGEDFNLSYTIYNTSKDKNLRNIKIALSSDEGTFIPVGSSNTMYIESIGTRRSASKSIVLSCKPDAVQKTIAVNLDMTYEDTKGNEYTAKEVISVPVVQKTKLRIDEITLPFESYVGQQTGLSVNFYNIGKTTLNNLTVSAEGNFTLPQPANYFVGNMESGKQDSYDLALVPKELGVVEGTITFSFEDVDGHSQIQEESFTFNATEAPPIDEGNIDMPIEEPGMKTWHKVALGSGILAVLVIVLLVLRHKKKKKEQELTIDEE